MNTDTGFSSVDKETRDIPEARKSPQGIQLAVQSWEKGGKGPYI